ncbi:ATP phosphoribosyltransferase [Flavobacterium aquatile]|uniref:ATP phosphoribosyltransferase n=1 Tax=Flavobacterium aquatile LMG 4008 = ATCC 11947 TaxID=1453498 RepID=A0A095SW59_9FLAO|nr:ATP phosphoribosyltransferase [Flavobacterium aquatile]KGD68916.1 ATP phosphoribosyltransferase [Flavobacterium aquatile LMG 4008 = ATCC 11947]OXA65629.1 ATP phosphoribosyltransferase [Flavobacterium aquatile LMG 4008 = ATCC 11947]GEC79565.1 ATP phosphoribosyltransferase [Flavobacterium aquatile]
MSTLKIAVQKSGRLSEKSLQLLEECGIKISNGERKLKAVAQNFPIEILFLRDDDIPQYVEQGVADIGILGENEVWEKDKEISIIQQLGFAGCRMSLAIPKDEVYTDLNYFEGKRIATSYPKILIDFFARNSINVFIEEISGSVEIATSIGLADAVFDIVSTGSTLLMNGLKEVATVTKSEAVLISNPNLTPENQAILDKLLFRMQSVREGKQNKYILLNAPNAAIERICSLLPGMKSPTILPLVNKDWSSLHSVIQEDDYWEIIEQLKNLGAEGILIIPIEKMIR